MLPPQNSYVLRSTLPRLEDEEWSASPSAAFTILASPKRSSVHAGKPLQSVHHNQIARSESSGAGKSNLGLTDCSIFKTLVMAFLLIVAVAVSVIAITTATIKAEGLARHYLSTTPASYKSISVGTEAALVEAKLEEDSQASFAVKNFHRRKEVLRKSAGAEKGFNNFKNDAGDLAGATDEEAESHEHERGDHPHKLVLARHPAQITMAPIAEETEKGLAEHLEADHKTYIEEVNDIQKEGGSDIKLLQFNTALELISRTSVLLPCYAPGRPVGCTQLAPPCGAHGGNNGCNPNRIYPCGSIGRAIWSSPASVPRILLSAKTFGADSNTYCAAYGNSLTIGEPMIIQFKGADKVCKEILVTIGENFGYNTKNKGDYNCMGRCGAGCESPAYSKLGIRLSLCSNWAVDCLRHDICSWYYSSATGLFDKDCGQTSFLAVDDFASGCLCKVRRPP